MYTLVAPISHSPFPLLAHHHNHDSTRFSSFFFSNNNKSLLLTNVSKNNSLRTTEDIEIEILKLDKNARRISSSKMGIDASLETVWKLLTDYDKLADFIPGLAVSQLLEKVDNRARLFQIGQQNLVFGLKFNAKGIVDCYEKDLERIPFGQRRDIEFKMIDGDFEIFEGKWSVEETNCESQEVINSSVEQEFQTTLSYVVDVKPKLWLPVGLVEGRLCKEIKLNLLCIRQQAQKAIHEEVHTC
ncbi:hypothetical protein IFM89_020148 [Coptis chinensis]|uniref:Coenzyme Q-binding protein COQ10 START domain-containing protein n=1 Tax=Coptis chinensis TaxID=261450 RepID=A0A835H549_9MAGN|nr:hypothetical protein IFM89_020148 [Coptis chinensis]